MQTSGQFKFALYNKWLALKNKTRETEIASNKWELRISASSNKWETTIYYFLGTSAVNTF